MVETTQRLFFALCPDSATRARLARAGAVLHRGWGGRPMRAENLHMTLVFLGAAPAGALDALLALGAAQNLPRTVLRLTHAECWQRSRVAVLCPDEAAVPLLHLVGSLQRGLEAAGLTFDRRAWHPHVTLLRDARCDAGEAVLESIAWDVQEFALLASRHDVSSVRYEALGRWPAGGSWGPPS